MECTLAFGAKPFAWDPGEPEGGKGADSPEKNRLFLLWQAQGPVPRR